jgi:aspartyl-tRNA(Asn)/glutamyl-tRNA(Gln) amidotransferase subunit C
VLPPTPRLEDTADREELARVPAISRAEVAHLARLARIAMTEAELDHYAGQLDVILDSVSRIREVATDDVPPTSHPLPLVNVLRPDDARSGLRQDEALAGAPACAEGRFQVPRILDEPS